MAKAKYGLRVRYCENALEVDRNGKVLAAASRGWFLQVRRSSRWYSLLNLRFARERDAQRAARALTEAGLDCHNALCKCHPLRVKQIACEFLQW